VIGVGFAPPAMQTHPVKPDQAPTATAVPAADCRAASTAARTPAESTPQA
jgi:hypothetical protein